MLLISHKRPDITIVENKMKKVLIIDNAIPWDSDLCSTIEGKTEM